MNAKQLRKIDSELDYNFSKDNILINKRGFFLYYNEPNKRLKDINIHSHDCGFCTWGSGRETVKEVGRNGVWIGPFRSTDQAETFARNVLIIENVSRHSCC
jgi:hypothetical protein